MSVERQLVNSATHEAMPAVKIGETTGIAGIVLIVETAIEGHGGVRNIVDRFGKGVVAEPIQSLPEAVRNGRLQRMVVRIRVGGERFECAGRESQEGCTRVGVFRRCIYNLTGIPRSPYTCTTDAWDRNWTLRRGQSRLVRIVGRT